MAPPAKPWFRFYTEALSDRKLRRLAPEHRWLWVAVLGAARMSRTPGALYVGDNDPMTDDDLADVAAMPVEQVRAGMAAFVESGMVNIDQQGAWVVAKWCDRQFESDVSTTRTRKHRSMERSITVPETPQEQPMERHQKTETDTDTEPLRVEPEPTPPAPPPEALGTERKTRTGTPRKRDDLFDAVIAACGLDYTEIPKTAMGGYAKRVHELREIGATPTEVHARAARYRQQWPTTTLTPHALAKQWAACRPTTEPAAPEADQRVRIRDGRREVFVPGAGWCTETRPRELADWET